MKDWHLIAAALALFLLIGGLQYSSYLENEFYRINRYAVNRMNITNTTTYINISGNATLENARLLSEASGEWIEGDVYLNDGDIILNGTGQTVDGVDISSHVSDTDNPHEVTKSQIGLGNVENTALSTWGGSEYITNIGTLNDLTINNTNGNALKVIHNSTAASDIGIEYVQIGNASTLGAKFSINESFYIQMLLGEDAAQYSVGYSVLRLNRNLHGTSINGPIFDIYQSDAADTNIVQRLVNGGTGTGVFIDQEGDAKGINVDSESANQQAIYITAKYGERITQDLNGGYGLLVTRNLNQAGSNALAKFLNDHTANTQPTVTIQDDGDTGGSSGALYISTTNANNDNAIYHSSGAKLTQAGTWTNAPSYSYMKNTLKTSEQLDVLDIFRGLSLQSWQWRDIYTCRDVESESESGDKIIESVCLNNYASDKNIHYGAYLDDMSESFGIDSTGVNTQDWIGINQIAIKELLNKVDKLEARLDSICKNNPKLEGC